MVKYDIAFRKPFTDWKKLIIGILLSILPIIRWFAKGYIFESSGVGKAKVQGMPQWKNWADLFVKGLFGTIISFIYMIPAIAVFVYGAGSTLLGLITTYIGTVVPASAILGIAQGTTDIQAITPAITSNWPLAIPHLMKLAPVLVLATILGLLAKYVLPMAILNYIKSDKFGDAFKLGVVFKKALTGKYFLAWIVAGIITAVAFLILNWLWAVGPAAAWFMVGVISYSLFGQVFEEV